MNHNMHRNLYIQASSQFMITIQNQNSDCISSRVKLTYKVHCPELCHMCSPQAYFFAWLIHRKDDSEFLEVLRASDNGCIIFIEGTRKSFESQMQNHFIPQSHPGISRTYVFIHFGYLCCGREGYTIIEQWRINMCMVCLS